MLQPPCRPLVDCQPHALSHPDACIEDTHLGVAVSIPEHAAPLSLTQFVLALIHPAVGMPKRAPPLPLASNVLALVDGAVG